MRSVAADTTRTAFQLATLPKHEPELEACSNGPNKQKIQLYPNHYS